MATNVVSQVAMRRERHPADLAFIRFHTVMDTKVNFQVATLSKSLLAHIALEWLDVLVSADMNFETTGSRVRL